MTEISENIRYVGALQDFGVPYVALYVNYDERLLYILINLDPEDLDNPKYLAASVSAFEVEEYMENQKTLSDIISEKHLYIVQFQHEKMSIRNRVATSFREAVEDVDDFNSEFCDDAFWIHTFLNRIKNNKALINTYGNSVSR